MSKWQNFIFSTQCHLTRGHAAASSLVPWKELQVKLLLGCWTPMGWRHGPEVSDSYHSIHLIWSLTMVCLLCMTSRLEPSAGQDLWVVHYHWETEGLVHSGSIQLHLWGSEWGGSSFVLCKLSAGRCWSASYLWISHLSNPLDGFLTSPAQTLTLVTSW